MPQYPRSVEMASGVHIHSTADWIIYACGFVGGLILMPFYVRWYNKRRARPDGRDIFVDKGDERD